MVDGIKWQLHQFIFNTRLININFSFAQGSRLSSSAGFHMLHFDGLVGAYFTPLRILTGSFLCSTEEVTVLLCSVQIIDPSTPYSIFSFLKANSWFMSLADGCNKKSQGDHWEWMCCVVCGTKKNSRLILVSLPWEKKNQWNRQWLESLPTSPTKNETSKHGLPTRH